MSPLRTAEDRAALRRAVKEGVIDILVTDHAPHAAHEKEGTLDEAPCGFTGLDLALSLTWELVRAGVLAEADLQRLWCRTAGREIFHLPWNGFAPEIRRISFCWTRGRLGPGRDHVLQSLNTPLGRELHGALSTTGWAAGSCSDPGRGGGPVRIWGKRCKNYCAMRAFFVSNA